MSWLDLLGVLSPGEAANDAAASYIRGATITEAVRQGASSNSIIRALSAAGVGFQRQQALRVIAAERDRQLAGATTYQLDVTGSLEQAIGAGPPANWTGQFIHQVTATFRTRDEEGYYLLHTRTLGIKSSTLLTPEQAIMAGNDILTAPSVEGGEGYLANAGDVVTIGLSGAWWEVPYQGR